jgi:stage V sporulation protein K
MKAQVREIVSFVQSRGREELPCLHMVFRGNPGTGKTTVARILAEVFDAHGVNRRPGTFIETDRSGLVGQYIGHTATKTSNVMKEAMGGVLFIDEAYALGMYCADLGAGPDGAGGRRDFGPEALDRIVKVMEDQRDDLVCILAGYPAEMDRMLDTNPGLRDRVAFYVDFPDYNADELTGVFQQMAKDKGYTPSPKAIALLRGYLRGAVANGGRNFANARIVRKVIERAILKQAKRSTGRHLSAEDIGNALTDDDLAALAHREPVRRVGFQAAPLPKSTGPRPA